MAAARRKPVIWVTRPEPGNAGTCQRLSAMGFEPHALPLTKTVPVEAEPVLRATPDLIAVTSANAIRHLTDDLRSRLVSLPVYAVGEATAQAARDAGFADVTVSAGDASDLVGKIVQETVPDTSILYLAGETRTGTFESELAALGRASPVILEVYQTQKVSQMAHIQEQFLQGLLPDGVLIHSMTSAVAWRSETDNLQPGQSIGNPAYFCISQRVSDALKVADRSRIHVSDTPDEASLLNLVRDRLGA